MNEPSPTRHVSRTLAEARKGSSSLDGPPWAPYVRGASHSNTRWLGWRDDALESHSIGGSNEGPGTRRCGIGRSLFRGRLRRVERHALERAVDDFSVEQCSEE